MLHKLVVCNQCGPYRLSLLDYFHYFGVFATFESFQIQVLKIFSKGSCLLFIVTWHSSLKICRNSLKHSCSNLKVITGGFLKITSEEVMSTMNLLGTSGCKLCWGV